MPMSQQLFRACKIVWVTLYINANKLTLTNLNPPVRCRQGSKNGKQRSEKMDALA